MNKATLFQVFLTSNFCLKIFSSSENHPAMKDVLVREVERLLYRPNISPKGKLQHKWRHWRNYLEFFLSARVAEIFTSNQVPELFNSGKI
jgi:hypothetical protein